MAAVISMYFHPHSTHSTPPLDTLGALQYHPSDHPCCLSLCHPPDILVSSPCLNSLDLGTSRPQDCQTLEPCWHFWTLALAVPPLLFNPFNCHSAFPSGTPVCTFLTSISGIS